MVAKLQPNRVRRSYVGGGRIDAFTSFVSPCPEDWLASTTTAFNGGVEIEGEGLGRLEDGRLVRDVVGELPILVKLLDSDERLVVQAHPTVPFAKRFLNSPVGKTECWYFLPGTASNACVYLGFKPGVSEAIWREAVNACCESKDAAPRLLSLLHRVPVKAGDFVFVSGGMPHAIGAGCFMIELQEPSDLMVVAERFTPSGRVIPDKKMHCGLGWDKMFDVYDYRGLEFDDLCARYVKRAPSGRILGPELTDKFSMWRLGGGDALRLERETAVAVVTDGEGDVNGCHVRKGDRLLVSAERSIALDGNVGVVICS